MRVARKTLLDSGVPAEEVDAIDASVEEEVRDACSSPTRAPAADGGADARARVRPEPRGRARGSRSSTRITGNIWEGLTMRTIRYRDAVREAMIEEMKRDESVFLMGEEVGHYQGAYKVSEGMLELFGAQARDRHAHRRGGLRRHRRGRGHGRACGRSSSS